LTCFPTKKIAGSSPPEFFKGIGYRPFVDNLPFEAKNYFSQSLVALDEDQKAKAIGLFLKDDNSTAQDAFTDEAKVLIMYCIDGVSGSQSIEDIIFSNIMSPFFRVRNGHLEVAWSKKRLADNCFKGRWNSSILNGFGSGRTKRKPQIKEALICLIGYKLSLWTYESFARTKTADHQVHYENISIAIDDFHETSLSAKNSHIVSTDLAQDALGQYFPLPSLASSLAIARTDESNSMRAAVRSRYDFNGKLPKYLTERDVIHVEDEEANERDARENATVQPGRYVSILLKSWYLQYLKIIQLGSGILLDNEEKKAGPLQETNAPRSLQEPLGGPGKMYLFYLLN